MARVGSMQDEVEALLTQRRGHFVFESGHHGTIKLDLELLMLHPARVAPLAAALAERLRASRPTAICGPLVEGAFLGMMVARALDLPFTYSEPKPDMGKTGLFPVAYPIPAPLTVVLRGERVALVNDVVNAGSAVGGTLAALTACNAEPVAIGTLAVYGDAARDLAATYGIPLETLSAFPKQIFVPAACPLCAQGVPLST